MNREQELINKICEYIRENNATPPDAESWLKEYAKEYHEAETLRVWKEQTTWQLRTAEREMTQDTRSRFAGLAMQGILASDQNTDSWMDSEKVAQKSIEYADALVEKLYPQSIDNQNKEA